MIDLYRNPVGYKKPNGGNCKHNIEGQKDIFFYRDEQIGEKHDPHNHPCERHEGHHKHDLRFLRVKQVGAREADASGQQRGAYANK